MIAPSSTIEATSNGNHGAIKSMKIRLAREKSITESIIIGESRNEYKALIDTGAEISLVSMDIIEIEKLGCEQPSVDVIEGIIPGTQEPVLADLRRNIRLPGAGMEGYMKAHVINAIPNLPPIVLGLDTLKNNHWSIIWSRNGYTLKQEVKESEKQEGVYGIEEEKEAVIEVKVIKIQEGDEEPEVIYELPAGEDVEMEEEDHMPPEQVQEEEVKKLINERLTELGKPKERSARFWEKLKLTLHQWWKPLSNKVGGVTEFEHAIDTGEAQPVHKRPYRTSPDDWEWLEEQVKEWLQQGLIEKSKSAWATPHVIVKKKDGTRRVAWDFRGVNEVTVDDMYPMPRVDEILDEMTHSRIFTSLDMMWGYWQIPMKQVDKEKTAFRTREGLYHWKVMPFGLKNAPATFQRVMNHILRGIKGVRPYIDDVMIHTPDEEGHLRTLETVFDRLQHAGMVCKLKKCAFARTETEFLGFIVGGGKVKMQPILVEKILGLPEPTNKKQIRRFVGMCSFYRHFIKGFSSIAAPLTSVMGAKAEWKWDEAQREAYAQLRAIVIADPVLRLPDFEKPFTIYTDASDIGTGAVLVQYNEENKPYAVRYLSRKLLDAETRYSTTEKEYLAIIHALRAFKVYVLGKEVTICTDHQPLTHMIRKSGESHSARVKRWAAELQAFDLKVKYIPGENNQVADALSRDPFIEVEDAEDEDRLEEEDVEFVRLVKPKVLDAPTEPKNAVKEEQDEHEHGDILDSVLQEAQDGYWEEMALRQRRCPEVGPLFKKVEEGKEVRKDGGILIIEDHCLFKLEKDGRKRLVVPQGEREAILTFVHEDPMHGGHFSARRGMLKARTRWWWPGIYRALEQWVATCRKCASVQYNRGHTKIKELQPRRRPMAPWEEVHIDMIGPFPKAAGGYQFILVAIDAMSEYMIASPVRRATAEAFLSWLRKDLIAKYGPMRRLLSDRGSNFMSDLSLAMIEMWGIHKLTTTAWRPQANGLVERANRTFKGLMRAYVEDVGGKWPTLMVDWVYAYNTTVHSATGFTPFHLFHGWEAKMPYDMLLLHKGESPFNTIEEYRNNMIQVVEENWAEARRNRDETDRAKQWNLNTVARRQNGVPKYAQGDMVWISKPYYVGNESKAAQHVYMGPFEVQGTISPYNYLIDKDGVWDIVHVDRLKKYRPLDGSGPRERYQQYKLRELAREQQEEEELETTVKNEAKEGEEFNTDTVKRRVRFEDEEEERKEESDSSDSENEDEEDEDVYEVEEILDKRIERGSSRLGTVNQLKYLIKWKGYDDSYNTWERVENLSGCRELVEEFERKKEAKGDYHPQRTKKW